MGFPIRKSPDQRLCASPRSLSQLITSFIATESQGIRHAPGFALFRHSSPSFGSQHICSYSNLSPKFMIGRWCTLRFPPQLHKKPLLSLRARVFHSNTRTHVRLLGPCYKTGWLQPFRPHHDVTDPEGRIRVTLLLNLQARQKRRAITPEGYLPNSHLPRHKIDVDLHTPTI